MLLTRSSSAVSAVFRFDTGAGEPMSGFTSFQLSPPPPTNDNTAIAGPGPQTTQYRQERDRLGDNPQASTLTSGRYAGQLPPSPAPEDVILSPGYQLTQYQLQNPSRPGPNTNDEWPGPSGENWDNSYGPKN